MTMMLMSVCQQGPEAPIPKAIFSSAARGSAAKNRNSFCHERHCLHCCRCPTIGHQPAARQETTAASCEITWSQRLAALAALRK